MRVAQLSKIVYLFLIWVVFLTACQSDQTDSVAESSAENQSTAAVGITPDADLKFYFDNEISGEYVNVYATVIKSLADDNEGSRHQKFLIQLKSGQTLLVAHNIDLARRIENLTVGDEIRVAGQYEWNNRGGVIHWTHLDPDGSHIGGQIEHQSVIYQ